MLTRNFLFAECVIAGVPDSTSGSIYIKTSDGATMSTGQVSYLDARSKSWLKALFQSHNGKSITAGVFFGTDVTPPKTTDYKINSIADVSVKAPDNANCIIFDYQRAVMQIPYKVTANEDCTIAEVGLFASIYGQSFYTYYLVDRTLLDEPVTLSAGESVFILYEITI